MNSALKQIIPPGHVAHFRTAPNGEVEVEFLRFLTRGEAKSRRDRPENRRRQCS